MPRCGRRASDCWRRFRRFTSVAGTAEATTLADASVDFVTAAQAAHWFDRARARREFVRILKPGGWLVLLWNERVTDGTPFLRDYEQLLLTYGTDYADVRHERTTDAVNEFFDPAPFQERVFDNAAGVRLRGPGRAAAVVVVCAGTGASEACADAGRSCGESLTCTRSMGAWPSTTRRECTSAHWADRRRGKAITTKDTKDHEGNQTRSPRFHFVFEVNLSDEKSFHMTPDEFRRHGHAVVDWIADYQSRVESFPVLSQVKPGEIRASLPAQILPRRASRLMRC